MVLAVVTALSLMQAAGGLDYVVERAEALLRRNPKRITLLAPLVTYALIFASGTQHVIYALLPGDRGGGAEGRHPARASALDQRDRRAARARRLADLGGDGGARRRPRRTRRSGCRRSCW